MCLEQLGAIFKAIDSDTWANQLRIYLVETCEMTQEEFEEELRIMRLAHLWELDPGFEENVYRCEKSCFEYIGEFEDDTLIMMHDDLEVYFNVDGSDKV